MNWLRVSIFCLIATASVGLAQDVAPDPDSDGERDVTVMMAGPIPPPDTDVIVLLDAPHEGYQQQDFDGASKWYYSADGAFTWERFDHHLQIQAPRDFPTKIPGEFEGDINGLGLGQHHDDSDSQTHLSKRGNTVLIMDDDLLHIIDMSNHVIASIDYYNGFYCSSWPEPFADNDRLEAHPECFDLYYFNEPTRVQIRRIIETARFELGISYILNSKADPDDNPELHISEYLDRSPMTISHFGEWVRWEDIDDPGPYILAGIALSRCPVRFHCGTGEFANISEREGTAIRTVLGVLSTLNSSNDSVNLHLVASDYILWQYLIWNLSNINEEEEKH